MGRMKKKLFYTLFSLLLSVATLWGAEARIEVFPTAPYTRYLIYESLAIFWLFILSLVVIIRLKLREIARTQKLGINREGTTIPKLE